MIEGKAGEQDPQVQRRVFTILNKYGIHARPAALFVKAAGAFESEILVIKDGNTVNGKSIMGLLTIEGHHGAKIEVVATGPDAVEALASIQSLIERKFDEE